MEVVIQDSGFEDPPLGPGQARGFPGGSAWSYPAGGGGLAGVAHDGSGWAPPALEGSQFLIVGSYDSNVSWAYQDLDFGPGGTFRFSGLAARKPSFDAGGFQVALDGVVIYSNAPGLDWAAWTTPTVAISAGTHTLGLASAPYPGGGTFCAVDAISIADVTPPPPSAAAPGVNGSAVPKWSPPPSGRPSGRPFGRGR